MRNLLIGTTALMMGLAATAANAADLRIGLSAEPSALDPHYHNLVPNNAMAKHAFNTLVEQDENQRLEPGLATSWKAVDDTTWEFKLRKGVKFHDGTPFTAKDVMFSLCRVPKVPNSPSAFTIYMKAIESMEAPDDTTVVMKTATPYPLLPTDISTIQIVAANTGKVTGPIVFKKDGCEGIESYPSTEDFNSGKAMNGTGPFKFKEFVKGDRIVMVRNPDYWGEKAAWDTVTFKPILADGPRVAALLAGDVDFIENPPSQDLPRLRQDKSVRIVDGLSNRVIYIALNSGPKVHPGIKGADKNPLADPKVRKALSLAIDRKAIDAKIMNGQAEPAGQLISPGLFGHNPKIPVDAYDPKGAQKLLAEAGFPKGFEITLGSPNDRYMNDEKVTQAVAQYWTRIGVKTNVDAVTASVFFSRRGKQEFAAYLAGWGAGTGEASSPLKSLVACRDKEKGYGTTNYAEYCNKQMDATLDQALATIDDAKREALLQKAMAEVMADTGMIPVHFEKTPWAMKAGLTYKARVDQQTMAQDVRPAK
ncbi:putative oligopeptide ABC transporter (Substrate-binding protein) [uncultured Alphaproteobacteria bacterium]|uniref:Putative oligopeptide ABC transporter (Substrate-binding protein) n=1 Tax=uncultured Alphaproteobacteria bacterium TaxID=91750 RepID=A0A212KGM2_9PROT|nr:putative oligopeptide ABC transporter (Substrate-binding protein) [uncultured Alphaproteobacteria bacterium]